MFSYCVGELHMSEAEAYVRIEVARLSREYPTVLEWLARGQVHLTAIRLIAPLLTEDNQRELMEVVSGKSKAQVLEVVARRAAKPDVATIIRKLPQTPLAERQPQPTLAEQPPFAPRPGARAPQPRPGELSPLSEDRFKLQLTVSRRLKDKLETAGHLLRHQLPSGDLEAICERAVDLLIEDQMKKRFAKTDRPAKRRDHSRRSDGRSRHVPTRSNAVWSSVTVGAAPS